MTTLAERSRSLWDRIRQSPAFLPACIPIPADHVDLPPGGAFERGRHYFQARVNEMYLPYSRRWINTYLPLATTLTEFQYNRSLAALPFVVGPSLVEDRGVEIPDTGVAFRDTRVAGIAPYTGGRIALTVVLHRVERENLVRRLLSVVESAAGALDFSAQLGVYLKIAAVVLDGVESLFETGQVQPIIGYRTEFDPDAGRPLLPGYYALLANSSGEVQPDRLWVKENRLCYGQDLRSAVSVQDGGSSPLRGTEFVLYSLVQSEERSDLELLPFYPLWERVQREATQPGEEHFKSAKANMLSLYQTMSISPDLTEPHAARLLDEFVAKMQDLHRRAVELERLGMPAALQDLSDPQTLAMDRVLEGAVALLDL